MQMTYLHTAGFNKGLGLRFVLMLGLSAFWECSFISRFHIYTTQSSVLYYVETVWYDITCSPCITIREWKTDFTDIMRLFTLE